MRKYEIMNLIQDMLLLVRPSCFVRVFWSMVDIVLLLCIWFDPEMQPAYANAYLVILALILFGIWISYIVATVKYHRFKNKTLQDFESKLNSDDIS